MLTRKEGRNYVIYGDKKLTINAIQTDEAISYLINNISKLSKMIDDMYRTNPELYYLLFEEVGYEPDAHSGNFHNMNYFVETLKEFQENLKTDDEIEEETKEAYEPDLEVYGFRNTGGGLYEKILENTDEREVAEEVYLPEMLYRTRTVLWQKTRYGKQSKDIKYKKLRWNSALKKAAERTAKKLQRDKQ